MRCGADVFVSAFDGLVLFALFTETFEFVLFAEFEIV
jgi:hypothetical protein